MSLDVNLKVKGEGEVFSSTITHNLGKMAAACGVYYVYRDWETKTLLFLEM